MKKLFILLWISVACIPSHAQISRLIETETEANYRDTLLTVCLKKYLKTEVKRNLIVIGSNQLMNFDYSLELLMPMAKEYKYSFIIISDFSKIKQSEINVSMIWFITSLKEFSLMDIKQFNDCMTINFVPLKSQKSMTVKLGDFFNKMPIYKNIVVIRIKRNKNRGILSQATIYDNGFYSRKIVNEVVIDECKYNEQRANVTHFTATKKLPELNVLASAFEPYTFHDKNKDIYKGIDYYLVETIAKELAIKVNYIPAMDCLQCNVSQ